MVSNSSKGVSGSGLQKRRFKGVRMRSWGKWVSEIRLPNTRARLWLGSFATAHQAARAFDVTVVCLRGRSAAINFPDSPPAHAPPGLPHHQIQELAAAAAAAAGGDDGAPSGPQRTSDRTPSSSTLESQSEPAFAACCFSPSYSCCNELEHATQSCSCPSACYGEDETPMHTLPPWECSAAQLCLGVHWDELFWDDFCLSSHSAGENRVAMFPLLPLHDIMVDDTKLWNL